MSDINCWKLDRKPWSNNVVGPYIKTGPVFPLDTLKLHFPGKLCCKNAIKVQRRNFYAKSLRNNSAEVKKHLRTIFVTNVQLQLQEKQYCSSSSSSNSSSSGWKLIWVCTTNCNISHGGNNIVDSELSEHCIITDPHPTMMQIINFAAIPIKGVSIVAQAGILWEFAGEETK